MHELETGDTRLSMLFALKKETEDDITRRVSRRVERYLEKLKTHARTQGRLAEQLAGGHPTPQPPKEFEDDAPTLILRSRNSNQSTSTLPQTLPLSAQAPDSTVPAHSVVALQSQFGESKTKAKTSQILKESQSNTLRILGPDRADKSRTSESEGLESESSLFSEHIESFAVPGDSQFEKFQGNELGTSSFDESSIDLKRFAEVSKFSVNEAASEIPSQFGVDSKKNLSKKKSAPQNLKEQIDSLSGSDSTELPPSLFLSSRSSMIVFSILGLAVLAVLYFLLTFDKYVY